MGSVMYYYYCLIDIYPIAPLWVGSNSCILDIAPKWAWMYVVKKSCICLVYVACVTDFWDVLMEEEEAFYMVVKRLGLVAPNMCH